MRASRRRLPAVEALVGELYGRLVDDVPLTTAADGISRALRTHVIGLHHEELGHRGRMELGGSLGLGEMAELSQAYAQRFQGQNLWIERGAAMLQSQGYQSTDQILPLPELFESSYYQHVLRRMDVQHAVGINIRQRAGRTLAVLSFNRSAATGPMDDDEMRLVAALRPHLLNAYALYDQLDGLRDTNALLRTGFDAAPVALLVFDAQARVIELNAAASALLVAANGIQLLADGSLLVDRAPSRQALVAALTRVGGAVPAGPASVLISRVAEGAPRNLVLHLCATPIGSLRPRARIIGVLVDLDRRAEASYCRQMLQNLLGLTAQEAAVALSLHELGDLSQVAQRLCIGIATARSHLKNIFHKAGVNRQGELLRLVDRIVGLVPG